VRAAEIRGFIAFIAVIGAIVFAWNRIAAVDTTTDAASETTSSTSSTTTTTTLVGPTTTTQEQAVAAICARTEDLQLAIFVDSGGSEVVINQLLAQYWADVFDVASPDVRVELAAVVNFYERYVEVGEPFGYDTEAIIEDGDKERWEQLVTRPPAALEENRALVAFLCGAELPEPIELTESEFERIEARVDPPSRR